MKIISDENIPLVQDYFGSLGELILKPGREITRQDLLTTDILLVRSVTQVNQALLEGTSVQFVGSTTTGIDHMDTLWLNQAGIKWSVAIGCNRNAVVEYVMSVIAALQKMDFLMHSPVRAGVIGVGNIGQEVEVQLRALGWDVVLCDPFRMRNEKQFKGVFLEELQDLDFITLHTPLTYEGTYPTYHLIEKNFLQRQKKNSILVNTSRGAVINFADLKHYGTQLMWCLDVWENEPNIDLTILQQATIATPHIAGYSIQSKYRGIAMIHDAAVQQGIIPINDITSIPYPRYQLTESSSDWRARMLAVYDPLTTTQQMKNILMNNPKAFDEMRKHFPSRHEMEFVDFVKE